MNRRNPARGVESRTHGPAVMAAGDGLEGSYAGTLFSVPSGGKCKVIIPQLDPVNWRTANCSPAFTGSAGDAVLVTFDWDKQPWVLSLPAIVLPTLAQLGIARGTVSFTFTSSSASAPQTVTHGLSVAPAVVVLQSDPESSANGLAATVTNRGTTTFTANAFTTPLTSLSGTFSFDWVAIR